ncbi:MAG: SRPBCC family protein [Sandaracinaceae bacterium]
MDALLTRAWSFVDTERPHAAWPVTLLPGSLDEPLLLTAEGAMSNVCTHRGACLLDAPTDACTIRCPYHGRRFRLDGAISAAPGFEALPDEPLPAVASAALGPMRFASLDPAASFDDHLAPVRERLAFFPWETLAHDPASDRAFSLEAPWTLWCENYLEGFHIPYVHPSLARALDLARYSVEVFDRCALQIGDASEGEVAFALPPAHRDAGRRVGGFYLFVWPLTAINLYPWGVSLNAVQPLGPDRTRVVYRAYVARPELRDRGAGAGLDDVEAEDDAIVERAARGVRSRLYRQGGLSPTHEAAVAWFQDRLYRCSQEAPPPASRSGSSEDR